MRSAIEPGDESFHEELANAVTHGVGAVLAAAGLAFIVILAGLTGDPWVVAAASVYGATLFLVYLSSALYHGIWHEATKAVFLTLDHCAIFLLIAGTYTPITLIAFPQPLGWTLFGLIWAMATVGILLRLWIGRLHWIMIPMFLAMGWIGFLWKDLVFEQLGTAAAWLLLSGGLAYTAGVIFFLWRSLPFNHALWHLFVLCGSVCHFVAIALYVVPVAA